MNIGELEGRIRVLAGDPAGTIYSEVQLVNWINDGVKECVLLNNLCQKTASAVMTIGVDTYPLPTDILKLHSFTVRGEKIRIFTLEEWQQRNAGTGMQTGVETGLPFQAYTWAGNLVIYPKPEAAYDYKINYIYHPAPVAAGSPLLSLPIPEHYHLRLVAYVLAQVALQDEDLNKYATLMGQFTSGVIDLKDTINQEEDLYPFISVSDRDAGYDYGYFYG